MKRTKYGLVLLFVSNSLLSFTGKSFMTYRSQGFNLARSNSGWFRQCTENNISVAVEYTRSFDKHAINNYYFGSNELIFSGSRVENRGSCDILADYFGLPTDFRSSLRFCPQVKNIIAEFDGYWHVGCKDSDFGIRLTVPLAHTNWNLHPCETVLQEGTLDYPAGYMSSERILRNQLKNGALDVLMWGETFGDLEHPLQHGRIACNGLSKTALADISLAFEYKVVCTPCAMALLDVHVVIPTGTRSESIFLFEPQVGNGHHWAFGAGLTSRYDILTADECDVALALHFDARIQHLFKSTQKRSYDFKRNGPGSRYMLIMDMVKMVSIAQGFSPVPGQDLFTRQYITRLDYGIDATTLESSIDVIVQADILAKLSGSYRHWNFELGYNLWARSPERLINRQKLNHDFYGVKGDAQLYGFLFLSPDFAIPVPMNATQSHATLHKPQGAGNTVDNFVNNNADNAALAYNVGFPIAQTTIPSLVNTGVTSIAQENGSDPSITLSDFDINECSGLSPRAITQSIVGSIGHDYDWRCNHFYWLVGAQGEFATSTKHLKTAISQWGVWIKGGLNY